MPDILGEIRKRHPPAKLRKKKERLHIIQSSELKGKRPVGCSRKI